MDILLPVLVSAITTGALYALATVGLSLVWGAFGMLNMAHGVLLTIGGYAAFTAVTQLGLPVAFGLPAALLVGAVAGALLYALVVQFMLDMPRAQFETNIIIATFGVAIALENGVLLVYGAQPFAQPMVIPGQLQLGGVPVPTQSLVIVGITVVIMVLAAIAMKGTRAGRAIRATAQNQVAAQLQGVPVRRVYAQVLVIAGMLASACGVLLSSITQLSPTLGQDPLLKAFIMCVVAGLGNLPASIAASFVLAFVETGVDYLAGARWGFPSLLFIVIVVLIWRPSGAFGRAQVRRL
jgi:branched-chain amino acid transport system permease protein